MNDHVEIGHLTKYDAFRMDRDQVMDLETWFKIHTNDSFPQNHINSQVKIFCQFYNSCKIPSCTYYLKEAETKITMFAHFEDYHGNHKL